MLQKKYCKIEHVKNALDEFTDNNGFTDDQIQSFKPFGLGYGKRNEVSYDSNIRGNFHDDTVAIIDSAIETRDQEILNRDYQIECLNEKMEMTETEKTEVVNKIGELTTEKDELIAERDELKKKMYVLDRVYLN